MSTKEYKFTTFPLFDKKTKFEPVEIMEKLERRMYKNTVSDSGRRVRPTKVFVTSSTWEVIRNRMTATGYRLCIFKNPVRGRVGTIMGISILLDEVLPYGTIRMQHVWKSAQETSDGELAYNGPTGSAPFAHLDY